MSKKNKNKIIKTAINKQLTHEIINLQKLTYKTVLQYYNTKIKKKQKVVTYKNETTKVKNSC